MSGHTKEPWRVRELKRDGEVVDCFVEAEKEGDMPYSLEIMGDDYTGYGDLERRQADARRIVACVNACAGSEITTERLESGAFNMRDLIDSVFRIAEAHVETMRQRNELLAALKSAVKTAGGMYLLSAHDYGRAIAAMEDEK